MRFAFHAAMAASLAFFTVGCGDDDGGGDEDAGPGDSGPMPDTGPAPDVGPPADTGPVPDATVDAGPPAMPRTLPTNGSAIAINPAGDLLVAANRTANVVSFFTIDSAASPPALTRTATLAVPDGEPWAAIWSNEGDIAYVVLRRSQEVLKIIDTRGTPTISVLRARTGSEPTGLAISPTGATLYVPSWVDGTVAEISTADMSVARTVDLNPALVATGALGTVTSRPALAHPRAIVVTNDGDADDADETVYVTEFFAQARPSAEVPADDSGFDVARQGLVYRYAAGSGEVGAAISIQPVADTGFVDSNMATTGCFPNQLYAAAIRGRKLYVSAVCASPRGPTGPIVDSATGMVTNAANFKTEVHTGVFVVDTVTNAELPAEGVLLPAAFQALYDREMRMDTGAARRIPLIALDLAFHPTGALYLPGYGSDALFRAQWNDDGTFAGVGSTLNDFVDLGTAPSGAGRLPIGLALGNGGTHAFVLNESTRNVSIVDLSSQSVVGVAAAADMPEAGTPEERINQGRRFFVTGLGRWSLRGQAWNSCETCHGDGLTDNVTWFFGRGPRQSTSLDGSFSPDGAEQRLFNWTAIFDETHDFELNTRGNSGGVGAIVHATSMPPVAADRIIFDGTTAPPGARSTSTVQAGLTGSTRSLMPGGATSPMSVLDDWELIEDYVRSIRAPRAATNLVAADVDGGRAVFNVANCAGCHGTPMWTISRVFYTPNETNNGSMLGRLITSPYVAPSAFPRAVNPPTDNVTRSATLRTSPFNAGNDQINCILRAVGTFPAMLDMMQTGVVPAGAPRVREVRTNMTAAAQGATGYNPPSLFGMTAGAPYFHAGNARTLEEVFSPTFAGHHTAFSATFTATGAEIRQLVAFLSSIDEETPPIAVPATLGFDPELCPDTF